MTSDDSPDTDERITDLMAARFTLADVREQTYKRRDAWWTILLVDPLAARLVVVTANRTRITPNQLTITAMLLGLGAAAAFWQATPWMLVLGAVLFHLSFVIDCMDGKIARLKGTGSVFGAWLDFLFDRVRDVLCAAALFGGQYRETDDVIYLWAALLFIAFNMFRYLNSAQVGKIRRAMNGEIARECALRGIDVGRYVIAAADDDDESAVEAAPTTPSTSARPSATDPAASTAPAAPNGTSAETTNANAGKALQRSFSDLFGWYLPMRDRLMRHRIRPHLFSGIEYQMFTFVVAPVLQAIWPGALLWTLLVSSILLAAFEALLVFKLWLSTKDQARMLAKIARTPLLDDHAGPEHAGPPGT